MKMRVTQLEKKLKFKQRYRPDKVVVHHEYRASVADLSHFESVIVMHQAQKATMLRALKLLRAALDPEGKSDAGGWQVSEIDSCIRLLSEMGTVAEFYQVQQAVASIDVTTGLPKLTEADHGAS